MPAGRAERLSGGAALRARCVGSSVHRNARTMFAIMTLWRAFKLSRLSSMVYLGAPEQSHTVMAEQHLNQATLRQATRAWGVARRGTAGT